MERDNFKCVFCRNDKDELHVHHIIYSGYKNPWEYEDKNFLTLCYFCHENEAGFLESQSLEKMNASEEFIVNLQILLRRPLKEILELTTIFRLAYEKGIYNAAWNRGDDIFTALDTLFSAMRREKRVRIGEINDIKNPKIPNPFTLRKLNPNRYNGENKNS